jgi:hypothetical protein
MRTPYHFLMPLVISDIDFIWSLSNFMIAFMHFTRSAACPPPTPSPPQTHTRSADVPEMSSSGTQAMQKDATQRSNMLAYLEHQLHGVGASLASGLGIRD